jgi:predicted RNA-binding Zn ribbon-like protein
METPVAVETRAARELPIVGGHPALDFANTIDDPVGPARFDHIAAYAGLLQWGSRVGVISPQTARQLHEVATTHPRAAVAALKEAHQLRDVVNSTFTAVATNTGSPSVQWRALQPFIIDAISHAEITPTTGSRGYHMVWPRSDNLNAVVWPVANAALALLTGPDLHRVKQCAGCPWLFLDQSKNSSRRWCAMNDCGTHEKIRRYVARRAARRSL